MRRHSRHGFQVRLTNFEGPFDLLLQLIFAHRLDVTEVALHQVTDDFIAYTREIGPQLELEETTAFLVVAATLLDLKAARLLPAGQVDDDEDLALLEVRDLLFARLLQYRAFKHVAEMFAELEAAALRSYPRAVSLEDRFADLLPEVMLGVDAERFAQIAAIAFSPRPVPTVAVEHLHQVQVSVPEQAKKLLAILEARGSGAVGDVLRAGRRLRGVDGDRRALPGAARTVSVPGGSIRPVRAAWRAPGFVDRGTSGQRSLGRSAGRMMTERTCRRSILDDLDAGIPDIAEVAPHGIRGTRLGARGAAAGGRHPGHRGGAGRRPPSNRCTGSPPSCRRWPSELTERDSGIDLRKNSEGWRMYTRARFAPYVEKLLLDGARSKLTRAALETLAVVAYRQPVTRARVSAVRGVNVDAVMRTLLARGLITEAGADDDTGAVTFATTELFLERLGLTSLADLPDIAPLLPDVDTIEDLSESLDSEPRFIKLAGGQAPDQALTFDVDQD